jgi:alkyl sulfatase BDS1-like metallo-beta-lactamase superfamily hydrolase
MNHGLKAAEIAERLALPASLASTWHVRGYCGTLSHNARSVYQRYLGWYDANPANLNPLPPVERQPPRWKLGASRLSRAAPRDHGPLRL